jgi:hypothetical protein
MGQLLARIERKQRAHSDLALSQAGTKLRAYLADIKLNKNRARECQRIGTTPSWVGLVGQAGQWRTVVHGVSPLVILSSISFTVMCRGSSSGSSLAISNIWYLMRRRPWMEQSRQPFVK